MSTQRRRSRTSAGRVRPVRRGTSPSRCCCGYRGRGNDALASGGSRTHSPSEIELMGFEAPPHRGCPNRNPSPRWRLPTPTMCEAWLAPESIGRAPSLRARRQLVRCDARARSRVRLFDDCPPAALILVDPLLRPPAHPVVAAGPRRVGRRFAAAHRQAALRARVASDNRAAAVRIRLSIDRRPWSSLLRMSKPSCARAHQPRPYPGSVVLITTEGDGGSARRRVRSDASVRPRRHRFASSPG